MMQADDGHIIVDVRRQDEYDSGHIPCAILIPNESIGTEQPKELPDLDQVKRRCSLLRSAIQSMFRRASKNPHPEQSSEKNKNSVKSQKTDLPKVAIRVFAK